jgi:hypothetical protein
LPRATLAIGAIVCFLLAGQAFAFQNQAVPVPKSTVKVHKLYETLHQKAERSKQVHAGRDVLNSGRAKDGKVSHALIRAEYVRLYREFHPGVEGLLYRTWRKTGSTHAVVEQAFRLKGTPAWEQAVWRCIIKNESGWTYNIYYGGHTYPIVSDSVLGLLQFKPHWGSVAQRSDPVWSILRALRYQDETGGFQPWFAQAGTCF